jgi:superfamily II DNA helicase RecQ
MSYIAQWAEGGASWWSILVGFLGERQATKIRSQNSKQHRLGHHHQHRTPPSSSPQLLTNRQQQGFVATSALGLGVDRGSIRHVFFLGQIRRLRDLVQQSGRAGRDGAPSKATIIRGALYASNGKRRIGGRFGHIEPEVHELIQGDSCIRVVLDCEMDGYERLMCKSGEEACSRCLEKQVSEEEEEMLSGREKTVEDGAAVAGAARRRMGQDPGRPVPVCRLVDPTGDIDMGGS